MNLKNRILISVFSIIALAIFITWMVIYNYAQIIVYDTWIIMIPYVLSALLVFIPVYFSLNSIIRKQIYEENEKIIKHQNEIEELNLELKKFKKAVDNASDYITILNSEKVVLYLNNSFKKELWYSDEEILWKSCSIFRENNWKIKISDVMMELKKDKKSLTKELKVKRKDWSNFISRNHITPILDNWEIIYYLCIEHDITKEKEMEDMKNEFIFIASHELRTPMTVINWYSNMLMDWRMWDINENQKKYLERISKNTTWLINIVNDMLDIGKLEWEKMEFSYEEFDFKEFSDEIIWWFQDIVKNKNIELTGITKNLVINSDKNKLKQVLTNFIWNAYKFTPNDWKIELILEEIKQKNKIKVSIKDNWIWIKKEDQKKLFKKFSQIDWPLQRKEEWTWLWLVVCKMIIENMWWTVWIESSEGNWSIFYFYLPIEEK